MNTKIRKDVRHCLLVEADDLSRLDEFLRSKYDKIAYVAKCIDGSELSTASIIDLLSYDNPRSRQLKAITISARSGYEEWANITIGAGSFIYDPAELTVQSADDERAVQIATKIVDFCSGMKPTYNLLGRFSLWQVAAFGSLAWTVFASLLKLFGLVKPIQPMPPEVSWIEVFNFLLVVILVGAVIGLLCERAWAILYPRVFFAIGKGVRRGEDLSRWRWILFSGILLAVVIGLLVNFFYDHLKTPS